MRTIDDEDLFYLMSRGLSPAESRRSLFEAFLMPLLDALPSEASAVRQELLDLVAEEVPHV